MILQFASEHPTFSVSDLYAALREQWTATQKAMAWQVSELVKTGALARISRGYFALNDKKSFRPVLSPNALQIGRYLQKNYPLLQFCMYESEHISSLQHHLAYTNTLYVETERDGVEAVFHALAERYSQVFLSPDAMDINRYLDASKRNIIVKPLISEAPLQGKETVKTPTIEKLLVDIYCDKVFFYLQGAEYDYIWENAHTLYNINRTSLLRYASRRGVKEEFNTLLNNDK